MAHASRTWFERRRRMPGAVQPLLPSGRVTRLVALAAVAVLLMSCGKLLGITDPTPSETGDGGIDASDDGSLPPPPPVCANPVTPAVFQAEQTFALAASGVGIGAGKLVLGGGIDLAIAEGDRVEIMLGDGAGAFTSRGTITAPAEGVVVDDFDGDAEGDPGDPVRFDDDLVVWNSSQIVAIRQEGGVFQPAQPLTGPFAGIRVAMRGHLNGGGLPDLIVKDSNGARRFTANAGQLGTFSRDASPIPGIDANDTLAAVQDIDQLEQDDVAVVRSPGDVRLAVSAPGQIPPYGPPYIVARVGEARAAVFGNFNHPASDDGLDLIIATPAGGKLYTNKAGQFTAVPGAIPAITAGPIQVIDVNGDSHDDLVTPTGIVYQCPPEAATGPGAFTQFEALDTSGVSRVVDLTADGKPDLVRVTGSTLRVRIQ